MEDAQKVVAALKDCATESFSVCLNCPYLGRCTDLLDDAISLIEAGYDLKEVKNAL